MSDQMVSRRRTSQVRTVLVSMTLLTATVIVSPTAFGATKDRALTIADYAFVTSTHSRPSHAVTAADLLNAAETEPIVGSNLSLLANIGVIFAYPRLALFVNSTTFVQTCVDFPTQVGQRPFEIKCPPSALALWQEQPLVLNGSREAVASAESKGLAVSGSDVSHFFVGSNVHVVGNPTFKQGKGGIVRFAIKLKVNKIPASGDICVRFPSTEAGIPVEVAC